jgi:hypothetical protein
MINTFINVAMQVKDEGAGLNITQQKGFTDGTSPVVVQEVYVLPASQALFQRLTQGDIATIAGIMINVTNRPATFAGIAVAIADTIPSSGDDIITDLKIQQGAIIKGIWVKNLDTVAACTITVILTGTNS